MLDQVHEFSKEAGSPTECSIDRPTDRVPLLFLQLSADTFAWTLTSTATLKALGQTIKNLKVDKVLNMNGKQFLAIYGQR